MVARILAAALVLLSATTVIAAFSTTPSFRQTINLLVAYFVLTITAIPAVIAALWSRRIGMAIGVAGVLVGTIAVTSEVERILWRWSRADFDTVANGADVDCGPEAECSLGWWQVRSAEHFDDIVVVWLPPTPECYAGRAVAMPLAEAGNERTIATMATRNRDVPEDYIGTSEWHDGWYHLCLRT